MESNAIVLVSGLPRSGTSMMMKMLEAGGMKALTDNVRTADEDNPKGYYELEIVKKPDEDQSWVEGAQGKVVKVISQLLKPLPKEYDYRVIFMRRDMDEILASQNRMLIRRGEDADAISDEQMAMIFDRHLKGIEKWLVEQPNFKVIYVSYNDTLEDPAHEARRVNQFLEQNLDEREMVSVVDQVLYRQRR